MILYIFHWQCQLNKVDRMPISTTYFSQIVFVLDLGMSFAESFVKMQYLVTILSHNITR